MCRHQPLVGILVASFVSLVHASLPPPPHSIADSACVPAEVVKVRWLGEEKRDQVRWLMRNGQYEELERVTRVLMADAESRYGPYSPETGLALDYLVHALHGEGLGSQPEVRREAELALALKETWVDPHDPDRCFSLGQLASVLEEAGIIARARDAERASVACMEEVYGENDFRTASSRSNLAGVLVELGALEEARDLYARALATMEATLPEHPNVRITLTNLAGVLFDLGDYPGARAAYARALAHCEQYAGVETWGYANALNDLGNMQIAVGDHEEGRALVQRSIEILEKLFGPEAPELAASYLNLGDLCFAERKYAEAKGYYERAVRAAQSSGDPDSVVLIDQESRLARALLELGEIGQAQKILERALAVAEQQTGTESSRYGSRLGDLAIARAAAGDHAAARTLAERAAVVTEGVYGASSPYYAAQLLNLATVRLAAGDRDGALAAALQAEKIGREALQLTAESLSEREALLLAAHRARGIDLALTLLAARPDAEQSQRTWDAVARGRGLVLDELGQRRQSVSLASDPAVAALWSELATSRQRLARLVVTGPRQQPADLYRASLRQAQSEREAAERKLAAASRTFRDRLARRSIGIDEVIAALPRGSALVAYALFEKKELARVGFADPPGTLSYAAFTVGPGSEGPALVPLGPAKEIDGLVQAVLERIAQEAAAPGRSPKSSEAAYRDAARALRARIWDPVASRVEGAGQVFIVPDGALHLLPFPALPTADGGYLVERDAVLHILGTERDVAVPTPAAPGSGLLAVGGPAFDATSLFAALGPGNAAAPSTGPAATPASSTAELAPAPVFRGARSACGAFRTLHFDPLPAAEGEVAAVASVWRSAGGIARHGRAETLTGEAASETALKRDAPGRRTLHLATHGFFLRRDCPSTPASASPAERDGESAAVDAIENPLLLSGLALAGANHRDAAGAEEDDGVLTAEEVAALDLSGVEWAVLSACETGVGDVMAGEGVFGLQRAFQVAGARTVITSLWAVDDEATRTWMDQLYRARLVDAKPTAEAVRAASLSMLREGRDNGRGGHPYYWAGFVAVGDWR